MLETIAETGAEAGRAAPAPTDAGDARSGRRARMTRRPGKQSFVGGGVLVIALVFALVLAAPLLPLQAPNTQNISASFAGVSAEHWLGTDQYGRDLLSRIVWGTRTSLLAALTAVAVAAVIGVPLGVLGGYWGRGVDWTLGRVADIILTVPALVMLITVQSALQKGIYGQMVVLGFLLAPRIMRVVAAETRTMVSLPYMTAGRLSGCSHFRMLRRYVLPNVREQALVQISYLLGLSLIVETGISFLGIGVTPPGASLGTLLTGGTAMLAAHPLVITGPAVVLIILILLFNTLGDVAVKGEENA